MRSFTIQPVGPFSLEQAAGFGFGQRDAAGFRQWGGDPGERIMRLAFCVDGYRSQAGVELRQDATGVHGRIHGRADPDVVRDQVARVLSLDHDGGQLTAIGRRDPLIGELQELAPGLRPPLFYSPYEAAAWAVLALRRPSAQMAEVRRRLSQGHGRTFELAGQPMAALPLPEELLAIESWPGIPPVKIERLHGVARAALAGDLDAARLRSLGMEDGMVDLSRLAGIGPFYASLIMIRATGLADVLPIEEPKLQALVKDLYDLPALPGAEELTAIAEPWRPLRTWVAVLIRAVGSRLLDGSAVDQAG